MSDKGRDQKKPKAFDTCPHCGRELSPWEKVLLGVDRALVCKRCWYRIILDVRQDQADRGGTDTSHAKDKTS